MDKIIEFLPIILPIILLHLTLVIISILNISKTKKVKHLTIPIWIIIILFLQIFGPICYLFVGRVDG